MATSGDRDMAIDRRTADFFESAGDSDAAQRHREAAVVDDAHALEEDEAASAAARDAEESG